MKKGRKFLGGKYGRYEQNGPARYQAGWEHDGLSLEEVVAAKFPKTGEESRAVRRERMRKALRYWARGQLRAWSADYEVYGPMVEEIDRMVKAKRPLAEVKGMVLDRVMARSYSLGTSEYQQSGGRKPGMNDSIEEIEARFAELRRPDTEDKAVWSREEQRAELQENEEDLRGG